MILHHDGLSELADAALHAAVNVLKTACDVLLAHGLVVSFFSRVQGHDGDEFVLVLVVVVGVKALAGGDVRVFLPLLVQNKLLTDVVRAVIPYAPGFHCNVRLRVHLGDPGRPGACHGGLAEVEFEVNVQQLDHLHVIGDDELDIAGFSARQEGGVVEIQTAHAAVHMVASEEGVRVVRGGGNQVFLHKRLAERRGQHALSFLCKLIQGQQAHPGDYAGGIVGKLGGKLVVDRASRVNAVVDAVADALEVHVRGVGAQTGDGALQRGKIVDGIVGGLPGTVGVSAHGCIHVVHSQLEIEEGILGKVLCGGVQRHADAALNIINVYDLKQGQDQKHERRQGNRRFHDDRAALFLFLHGEASLLMRLRWFVEAVELRVKPDHEYPRTSST